MARPTTSLDGARELLDATLILVVSWASESVATVLAASPGECDVPALSLPRHLVEDRGGVYLEAPLSSDWFRALTLPSALFSGEPGAVLVVGTIARDESDALQGWPDGAFVVVWGDVRRVPAIVAERPHALRSLFDSLVRSVQSAAAEATSHVRLSTMLDAVPQGIVLTDEMANTARVNAAAAALLELPVGDVSASALGDAMRLLRERCADPQRLGDEGQVLFTSADASRRDWLWHIVRPDARYLRVTTLPVRATAHRGRVWTFDDVTSQTQQQQQLALALSNAEIESERLAATEERFRLAATATRDIIWDWDVVADVCTWATEGLKTTFGLDADAMRTNAQWNERIHPDDRPRVEATLEHLLNSDLTRFAAEYRLRRADESYAEVRDSRTVMRDADGRPIRMIGAIQDESVRTALEAQLHHSQKMESIGRLAGGVAHDFNNLLTVILASLDFVDASLPPASEIKADIGEAYQAAERAAALTRQLLALGRKQVLQPRVVDLRELVTGMERLLRRVLGEDVRLLVDCPTTEAHVHADPGQLEQALLNLAVNARDAMPNGGDLMIQVFATDPEPAGRFSPAAPPAARELVGKPHVLMMVRDTGTGMSPRIAAHAFEPFFTSKEPGKGSGLGLSIVHGIVTQSGGATWIDSLPDVGTTVWIVLPRVLDETVVQPHAEHRVSNVAPKLILLVEDEAAVRTLTERFLRRAGHSVVSAANGVEGLRIWRDHASDATEINAIISDVVMPEMGGREFVRTVRAERPQLPVLFVSGYAEGELSDAELTGRTAFLQKPFTADALLCQLAVVSMLE